MQQQQQHQIFAGIFCTQKSKYNPWLTCTLSYRWHNNVLLTYSALIHKVLHVCILLSLSERNGPVTSIRSSLLVIHNVRNHGLTCDIGSSA